MKLEKATLRQFKSLPSENKTEAFNKPKKTLPFGFVTNVFIDNETLELCKSEIGLTPEQMNSSFHKSWDKVTNTPQEQLWFEQIIHYFTTYGFKQLGIYSKDTVFIPHEKLEIPDLKEGICLIVVNGMTKDELKENVIKVLETGIALKEDTINDYLIILKYTGFSQDELKGIKNKEMSILLCDEFDIIPTNPVEFLRYVIYSITEKALLIKDQFTINSIKENKSNVPYKLFKKADLKHLSSIFNRFKPLFLAFKSDSRLVPYINKLGRLSKVYHKPLPEDYLNMITSVKLDTNRLNKSLELVNVFRKIRLLYALNIRLQNPDGLLYKIRNGKSWIKENNSTFDKTDFKKAYKIVLKSIIENLNVKDKKIHIPKGINYTLPATEKQFTDQFPSGTSITIKENMIVGIYWDDFKGNVDLDLSTISMNGKIGWNSVHKQEDLKALFSGDITDSSKGASELFYIEKGIKDPLLLINNLYSGERECPFKIFVGKEKINKMTRNRMINPNNILLRANSEMTKKQKVLGIIMPTKKGKIKFVLSENSTNGNISNSNPVTNMTRDYLYNYFTSAISLKRILKKAGAELVKKEDCEIDLSPEVVSKNDFINLLTK